jgi:ribose 5-phosphate isomerase B
MRIAIASDHAAWEAKTELVSELRKLGYWVDDLGTYDGASCDYPRLAFAVARRIASSEADRGVLLCGSGIGMAIAANRVAGVRAALVYDEQTAELSRRHNDANIICLGARLLPLDQLISLTQRFLETPFEGGRHENRIALIDTLAAEH